MNDILRQVADNQNLFDALKGKILEQFATENTVLDGLDDKRLGEVVRADLSGIKKVEAAFKEITQLKSPLPTPTRENPVR